MMARRLRPLWEQLQGKKPHYRNFLAELRLDGIRGIRDLRIPFDYPVSVIAGGNSTGKSTVLFTAACAYRVPDAGVRDFVPSTLFPDYRPKGSRRADSRQEITLEFDYATPNGRRSMMWRRRKGWNRSFYGRRGATQPDRGVYLRTLSNLSSPAEVRGILSMSRQADTTTATPLTASQIAFAHQMLPFRYEEVVALSAGRRNLLFAEQEGGAAYSELHMAAGERAILRLSREIAQLRGALVLIDEVEAGLHPWMQRLLLLHLQQLALRRELQVIVTSHSPVVLEAVPPNARIFLERDDRGRVRVSPPYRDLVQNALYGRASDTLNFLCEDDVAEGVLRGILDTVLPRQHIHHESVRIGRDTGAEEFAGHARAFRKFGTIEDFVFVLDGDKKEGAHARRIREAAGREVPVLFLPGRAAPEVWVWRQLRSGAEAVTGGFPLDAGGLTARMDQLDAIYDSASDSPGEIAKNKLHELTETLKVSVPDLCRRVARAEVESEDSDIQPLVSDVEDALIAWRARSTG